MDLVLHIRDGELLNTGSWVYAWLRPGTARPVIYVGGTGLPPAARAWLHLHSPDPEVGWIGAKYAAVGTEPLDVLAQELDPALPRPAVRAAVIQHLERHGLISDAYVGIQPETPPPDAGVTAAAESMVAAVRRYREAG